MKDLLSPLEKTQLQALRAGSWVFVWVAFGLLLTGVAFLFIQKFAGVSIDFFSDITAILILVVALLPALLVGLVDPLGDAVRMAASRPAPRARPAAAVQQPLVSATLLVDTPPPRLSLA